MCTEFTRPEDYFASLPPEFAREWLPARVENLDWPPTVRLAAWTRVLHETPEQFRGRRWTESEIDVGAIRWSAETTATIQGLSDACFRGVTNDWARHLRGSLAKIGRIQAYSNQHRKLPGKLLVTEKPDGFALVDGYHRVSWFNFVGNIFGAATPLACTAKVFMGR